MSRTQNAYYNKPPETIYIPDLLSMPEQLIQIQSAKEFKGKKKKITDFGSVAQLWVSHDFKSLQDIMLSEYAEI